MPLTAKKVEEISPERFCAFCDRSSSHYSVGPLTDDVPVNDVLRVCDACFEDLLGGDATSKKCAFCGKQAVYGTMRNRRVYKYGSRSAVTIERMPHYYVLCGDHFEEALNEVQKQKSQSQISDFC